MCSDSGSGSGNRAFPKSSLQLQLEVAFVSRSKMHLVSLSAW